MKRWCSRSAPRNFGFPVNVFIRCSSRSCGTGNRTPYLTTSSRSTWHDALSFYRVASIRVSLRSKLYYSYTHIPKRNSGVEKLVVVLETWTLCGVFEVSYHTAYSRLLRFPLLLRGTVYSSTPLYCCSVKCHERSHNPSGCRRFQLYRDLP